MLSLFTPWVRNCRLVAPMRKEPKPSPTESPMLFEIDPVPLEETLTALGGIPLVVQAFRSLGLPQSVKDHVRVKERERGYDEATLPIRLVPKTNEPIYLGHSILLSRVGLMTRPLLICFNFVSC